MAATAGRPPGFGQAAPGHRLDDRQMTTRHRHERLALVIGIAAGLALCAAHAQDAAAPPGEAYVDRIIAPQQLQELLPEEDELADTDGLPRSFHAEAIASRSEYGDDRFDEQGISVGGFRQTASWGTFSLDATLFHSDRQRFTGLDGNDDGFVGLAPLCQRDLYLAGARRVNHGLGVTNQPAPPPERNQSRCLTPKPRHSQ